MKLASRASTGVWVQRTAARVHYKTKCVNLESALKMNFPMLRQRPSQDLSSRGSRAHSTEGFTEPGLPIPGISAEDALMLTCWLIARGALGTMADKGDPNARALLDAMSDRNEGIIKLFYNDKEFRCESTCLPKDLVSKCESEAQLEDFMKEAFNVPASKPVRLYFKPAGEQEKSIFVNDFIEEQLEMAVAVYMDDE